MTDAAQDDAEKQFEPTPQKLKQARKKGDVARSTDLSVAAGYAGLALAFGMFGAASVMQLGTLFSVLLEQSDWMSAQMLQGSGASPALGVLAAVGRAVAPWFALPAVAVLLSVIAQRGLVFAPSKLRPKLSRISPVENARNKFGRRGLVEFLKSFAKLVIFSACLGLFLRARYPEIQLTLHSDAGFAAQTLGRLAVQLLMVTVFVSLAIGLLDLIWQMLEHRQRNRMTRKELQDEVKESEGDPHIRQQRRQRGQDIAASQMAAQVREADVVVVNPVHFAVALKWSRMPGTAPACVAKGVDDAALRIRAVADEAGIPVHHDPPTARALHASVEIGDEVPEALYRAVAAAIRFADRVQQKAKGGVT